MQSDFVATTGEDDPMMVISGNVSVGVGFGAHFTRRFGIGLGEGERGALPSPRHSITDSLSVGSSPWWGDCRTARFRGTKF